MEETARMKSWTRVWLGIIILLSGLGMLLCGIVFTMFALMVEGPLVSEKFIPGIAFIVMGMLAWLGAFLLFRDSRKELGKGLN
ncbi:hypothetical protein K8R43_00810 [archaeon]|nr:hypothetical protein [archaeon]